MKKLLVVPILLIAVLFLAVGCGEEVTTSTTGYIGGTEGMAIAYLSDAPPAKVMDNDQESFYVSLDLENMGEYDIQEAELIATVTGIDLNAFGIEDDTMKNLGIIRGLSKVRMGDSDQVLSGDKSYDISFNAKYMQDLPADIPFNLVTNVCYRYQTKATTSLCLRRDVIKKGDALDVCTIGEPITASNSGAPLQIVSMVENAISQNKVRLLIEIQNMGTGVAYLAPEALDAAKCSETGTDMKELRDKIRVTVGFIDGNPSVSCGTFGGSNTGIVQLISGQKSRVTCELDTSNLQETTFTKNPNVVVDYVYKDSVSQEMIVQNIA